MFFTTDLSTLDAVHVHDLFYTNKLCDNPMIRVHTSNGGTHSFDLLHTRAERCRDECVLKTSKAETERTDIWK